MKEGSSLPQEVLQRASDDVQDAIHAWGKELSKNSSIKSDVKNAVKKMIDISMNVEDKA